MFCAESTKTNAREKENQGNFGIFLDQSAHSNISSKEFQKAWLKDRFTNTGNVTSKLTITEPNKHQEARIYKVSLEE